MSKLINLGEMRYRLGSKLDLLGTNVVGQSGSTSAVWTPGQNDNPSLQEVNYYLNAGLDWLYNELAQADPLRYSATWWLTIQPGSTFNGVNGQPLPPDFVELLRCDYMIGTGQNGFTTSTPNPIWMPVMKTSLMEEASYQWNVFTTAAGPSYRYIIDGNNIRFLPTTQVGGQFRIKYLPNRPPLEANTDTFDGVNGWEEAAILWAAIQIKAKLDQDSSSFQQLLANYEERIEAMKQDRDSGSMDGTIDLDAGTFPIFSFPRSQ